MKMKIKSTCHRNNASGQQIDRTAKNLLCEQSFLHLHVGCDNAAFMY
jgi:hypothetical protein